MKKVIAIVLALAVALCMFAACSATQGTDETTAETADDTTVEETTEDVRPSEKITINIGLLKGPTGMGASYMLEQSDKGEARETYAATIDTAAQNLMSSLISGELDMCALPTNVISKIYNKTEGKIQLLAVNTLGVMYIMSNDESIASVADLKGKTILSAGQGDTPEYVLNYILSNNGLTVGEDVTVEYASEHAEVLSKAVAGEFDVVLLPEPFVTQMKGQDAGFVTVLNLTNEWEAIGGGMMTMGAIAVRKEFAEQNPEAVQAFLLDYAESVAYVNGNPEEASAIIESHDIIKAAVAKAAIPNCNMVCMSGDEMKTNVSAFLQILADSDMTSVGGAMPGADFYYGAE